METRSLIQIEQLCTHCNIDESFVLSLHELGHIELVFEDNNPYINESELKSLESLIYFNTELNINLEGIDAIGHLIKRIEQLQHELHSVKSQLNIYHQE
jgi:hypothetical protein